MDKSAKPYNITSKSSFTGRITARAVKLASISYSDSSGLDTLTIKGGTELDELKVMLHYSVPMKQLGYIC